MGPTISGMNAGTYVVTITNSLGCSAIDSTTIESLGVSIDSFTVTEPTCPNFPNGLIGVIISGGTGSQTFEWSNGADDQVIFGLDCGMNYSVTIMDAGCPEVVGSVFLDCPESIQVNLTTPTDVLCDMGACNGQVMATPSGGTAGTGSYDFTWNSDPTLLDLPFSNINTLCQGPNFLIVNDDNCPADTIFFDIGAPDPIEVDLAIVDIQDITCFGEMDGEITANAIGGVGGYDYQWVGGPNSSTYSGLGDGLYTLFITDANNCISNPQNFELEEPEQIEIQAVTEEPTCAGFDDGSAQMSFTGGTGSGSYIWSPNVSTNSQANGLVAGNYDVQVTDANGCMRDTMVMLTDPPAINYTLDPILDPSCFGETALVNVSMADGGSGGPYLFSVGSSVRRPVGTPIFILPEAGIEVEIYDINGCFATEVVDIPEPDEIQIIFSEEEYEIGLGESLLLNPIILNTIPIDSIFWSPVDTNFVVCQDSSSGVELCDAINVSPVVNTEYAITVIDDLGCQQDASILVKINNNRNVYIPNVFSPNDDGSNDFFSLFAGPAVLRINSVDIYTRWGEQVVGLKDIDPIGTQIDLWDGFASFNKRKRLNPGVFIYVIDIEFKDNNNFIFRGDVTLLR